MGENCQRLEGRLGRISQHPRAYHYEFFWSCFRWPRSPRNCQSKSTAKPVSGLPTPCRCCTYRAISSSTTTWASKKCWAPKPTPRSSTRPATSPPGTGVQEAECHGLEGVAVFEHYMKRLSQRGWGLFKIQDIDLDKGTASVKLEHSAFVYVQRQGRAQGRLHVHRLVCRCHGPDPASVVVRIRTVAEQVYGGPKRRR